MQAAARTIEETGARETRNKLVDVPSKRSPSGRVDQSHARQPNLPMLHLEKELKEEREKNAANVRRIALLEAELAATAERLAEAESTIIRFAAQRHLQGVTSSRKGPSHIRETQAKDAPGKVESETLKDFFNAMPDEKKDKCISVSRVSD